MSNLNLGLPVPGGVSAPLQFGLPKLTPTSLAYGSTAGMSYGAPTQSVTSSVSAAPKTPSGAIDTGMKTENVVPKSFGQNFWAGMTNDDGSINFGAIGDLTESIGNLASVYAAFDANRIAKDQLAFNRESFNKNFANQVASYNMNLEDRAYNRARQAGQTTAEADTYIQKHRLGA